MNRDARTAVIVGGIAVFGFGLLLGFVLGRAGQEEAPPVATLSPSVQPTTVPTASPPVVTPTPGDAPAIATAGAILLEGDRPVTALAATSACQSLVTAGSLGECGEVSVGGGRVIWVIERAPTGEGTTAVAARVLTFVPDAGGWVEWLRAEDATGTLWSDVNVLPSDLTGDGVAELLFGFREVGDSQTLQLDIVSYGEDNLPSVRAHPDEAAKGAVLVAGGTIQKYDAQYPNGEPVCCPGQYLRSTIAFRDGFFRVIATEQVPPNAVPTSQL